MQWPISASGLRGLSISSPTLNPCPSPLLLPWALWTRPRLPWARLRCRRGDATQPNRSALRGVRRRCKQRPCLDDQLGGGRFCTVPPPSTVVLLFFSNNCLNLD
jgi:hypothetical protein